MSLKLIVINIVLCVLGFVVVYASIGIADDSLSSNKLLRSVRVESQRLQQAINMLESAENQELIGKLDSSLSELKISLAEFMSDKHSIAGVSDVNFKMNVRKAVLLPRHIYPIRLLRLNVKYKADNSILTSEFIQSTKLAASPWPAEVKACEVHRLEINKLMVNCVLDIYYWGIYE